jgi:hypothetical protein
MPASRRRGDQWQNTLLQIAERGGGIELAIDRRGGPGFRSDPGVEVHAPPPDLLWRVRVRKVTDDAIVVENPVAIGKAILLAKGTRIVAVMAVGQNRWMFLSEVVAAFPGPDGTLHLAVPERVERCTRRSQQRVSSAEINLPEARCWPLRDPITAVPAEAANRQRILALQERAPADRAPFDDAELDRLSEIAPDVGPGFRAQVANIGGGGVGLKVRAEHASLVEGTRLYWMKLDLRPHIPAPLELIVRLAHTHLDSEQNIYAGMAFEFGLDPAHRAFVSEQIQRFMNFAVAS